MSLETTLARAARAAVLGQWRAHMRDCYACASSRRRKTPLCRNGAPIRADLTRAELALQRAERADAQPAAGQEQLDLGLT